MIWKFHGLCKNNQGNTETLAITIEKWDMVQQSHTKKKKKHGIQEWIKLWQKGKKSHRILLLQYFITRRLQTGKCIDKMEWYKTRMSMTKYKFHLNKLFPWELWEPTPLSLNQRKTLENAKRV